MFSKELTVNHKEIVTLLHVPENMRVLFYIVIKAKTIDATGQLTVKNNVMDNSQVLFIGNNLTSDLIVLESGETMSFESISGKFEIIIKGQFEEKA
jgi:hypothetical protein